MVRTFVAGLAGVNGARLRPRRARAGARHRRRRGPDRRAGRGAGAQGTTGQRRHPPRGRAHRRGDGARARGRPQVAREEIAAGAQLLLGGDMGIGNTTPAAALIAAGARAARPARSPAAAPASTRPRSRTRRRVIDQALARAGDRTADPVECLTALGSADLAAATGYLVAAAEAGVPVLLDGVISVACALTADRIAPGRCRVVRRRTPLHRAGPVARPRQARPRADPRPRACAWARAAVRSPPYPSSAARSACCATSRCSPTSCRMRDAWRLAVGTLTAIPVAAPRAVDAAYGRSGHAARSRSPCCRSGCSSGSSAGSANEPG